MFSRPTIAELIARIQADIETLLPGADARLRRHTEYVLAKAVAGLAHGLHGHLMWLSRQLLPDTAEASFAERWASIYGLEKKAAAKAAGGAGITGTNGALCPAATQWQRNDGTLYVQDADVTIAAGVGAVAVTAAEAGAAGNADASSKLSLVSPVTGVDSEAVVDASGLTGGLDREKDASLLSRLLSRIQSPPKGGGPDDYVNWALEVAGVTRAWQFPVDLGPGTVSVVFVCDDQAGSIIPDAAKVAEVQAYLDARRPVTADVQVYAPTAVAENCTLLVTPNTAAVQAEVEAQLEDFFRRKSVPRGTLYLSQFNEAISLATGEDDHVLAAPAANLVRTGYDLSVLGTVTFT